MSNWSERDLAQLKARGSTVAEVERQIAAFRSGFPPTVLDRPATIGDGLRRLDDAQLAAAIARYESATGLTTVKFVPSSGAASRMFKDLFDALHTADGAALPNKGSKEFFARIREFAFFADLNNALDGRLEALVQEQRWGAVLKALLLDADRGLDYGEQPKGLLRFHRYSATDVRTPLEEHLVEGARYCRGADGVVRVHFTVSPHHMDGFRAQMESVRSRFESELQCRFDVSYSVQKESTDTIAVTPSNEPFRLADGSLLFRPAGHGALIENLNDIHADVVFIKNIDNVVPDALKPTTVEYKKALAGVLLLERDRITSMVAALSGGGNVSATQLAEFEQYARTVLGYAPPAGVAVDAALLKKVLTRPLRVCGMVPNTGEPGGGPFWVRAADGSVSLQVVESAQMNLADAGQAAIMKAASHFNPVDLVCTAKSFGGDGAPYCSLLEHRDLTAGFIASKSQEGRELKAQELPGLWNGAMADWSTIFVEVPLITFNPVKTVIDLLRKEHQA